jgi:hypothetical protein
MTDYYDRLLAAIGASLGSGFLVGAVGPVTLRFGALSGALVATVFVYEGLFRNPPRPMPDGRRGAYAVAWHAAVLVLAVTAVGI